MFFVHLQCVVFGFRVQRYCFFGKLPNFRQEKLCENCIFPKNVTFLLCFLVKSTENLKKRQLQLLTYGK